MKPKIFIGSSVEALSVAYAIQQNLTHNAESTVWDQGIFQLSNTTIESIEESITTMDFGIFVFNADDAIKIRDKTSSAVRDNVLFELGLFIGKLGRKRVFFVLPRDEDLHIPTDLLGITPGFYETDREDGSYQAATGAVCNDIRTIVKKLGFINPKDEFLEASELDDGKSKEENSWIKDFFNSEYEEAKEKLISIMDDESNEDQLNDRAWLAYINFKMNEKDGFQELIKLSEEHPKNKELQKRISQIFMWEDYDEHAIKIAEKSLDESDDNNEIVKVLSDCHKKNGDLDKATGILKKYMPENNPEIAIAFSEINENKDESLKMLNITYRNNPNHENLIFKYARLLSEENHHKEALFLDDILTTKYHDNPNYWGYLGNTCLNLNLHDKAMTAYKKANDLFKTDEPWIQQNIGNILNNKGFYTEATQWLKKSLIIDEESQYAHDRLSVSIKNKDSEHAKFQEQTKEGKKLIRNVTTLLEEKVV